MNHLLPDAREQAPSGNGGPRQPREREVICVLGPARSGTSLTARIVNLLGFSLGPEAGLSPPSKLANPTGFWEQRAISGLNNRLLHHGGGDLREPPVMPPGWAEEPNLDKLREQARALIDEAFGEAERWAWKDPRAGVTLAFWEQLIPDMRYVICVRNPLDVAASAHRWGNWGIEENLELWRAYMAGAVANTAGRPRIFVAYDNFFDDWRVAVERLARFAGQPPPTEAVGRQIEELIDNGLRHHAAPSDALAEDERVSAGVAALYRSASELASVPAESSRSREAAELEEAVNRRARELLARRAAA